MSELPLELQIGAFHLFKRECDATAAGDFDGDVVTGRFDDRAVEVFQILDGLSENDFSPLATEALPFAPAPQFALDAWRGDFKLIGALDGIGFVQGGAHCARDQFAIAVGHAVFFVDDDTQQLIIAGALQLDFDELEMRRLGDALRDAFYGQDSLVPFQSFRSPIKKWACAHFSGSTVNDSITKIRRAPETLRAKISGCKKRKIRPIECISQHGDQSRAILCRGVYLAISIKDVAERAGVSIATVSHVVNATRVTREETRQKVLRAIEELGYSRNLAARNLARGRSSLLGLIISDIRNPFFPEVTAGFEDEAIEHEMDALVLNTNYDAGRTLAAVKRLIGLQVPGVAILTSQIDPEAADMLAQVGVASVSLDLGRVDRNHSNIVVDYEHGIADALRHLAALGHQRIGYIGGAPELLSARRRRQAFLQIAAAMKFDLVRAVDADFTVMGGYEACGSLLEEQRPTAVVTGNDLIAIGVLHRAFDAGLKVPADLSVVGFDDILFSAYTQPALTTVAIPRTEIGRAAFGALWSMINDPEHAGREYKVSTKLVERQSTIQASSREAVGSARS